MIFLAPTIFAQKKGYKALNGFCFATTHVTYKGDVITVF